MAMVMIDFTIVSISATTIQRDLHLSETAVQWLVTAYALSTAAFVALGGRLGDILGHKRIVVDRGHPVRRRLADVRPRARQRLDRGAWLIVFRVLQGVGGGLLIPSATVLVLDAFPAEERGKGLAIFFIVAGLFTAIGPIAGSYLTEYWTWRAIFWINVPVALLSLIEFASSSSTTSSTRRRSTCAAPSLIVVGMGLTVLGIQESTEWGWDSPATIGSIVAGIVVLAAFVADRAQDRGPADRRQRAASPTGRSRSTTCSPVPVLRTWLAVFFFGSIYFQVAVGQEPTQAGFSILTMFYSFFIASRIGGGWMDKFGAEETGRRSASCSARSGWSSGHRSSPN